jgi:acyl-CoA reductase-like NAD-dependent aldehyde dehydrogenase
MSTAREETFGPVIPITTIASDDEALEIANASPYGLLTAVWTRDLETFTEPKTVVVTL